MNDSGGTPSPEAAHKVREILMALAGLAGMLKIYPPDHAAAAAARADFGSKLLAFLESHPELELAVEETALLYEGQTAFADPNLQKSLPYLMFKDGLRSLTFHSGLTDAEILDFLGLLRQVAVLPPEEADFVSLMWERDFEHIGYVDSDEYLEAKIGAVERRPWERMGSPEELSRGRIDLKPDDAAAASEGRTAEPVAGDDEADALPTALNRSEIEFLASAFGAERSVPAETSFLDAFFELLCMEDRPSSLASMLQFADRHHQDLLRAGDYAHAALLLARLDGMKPRCSDTTPLKQADLERLAHRIKDSVSLASLKEEAQRGRVGDPAGFFAYLEQFGPRAVPLAADLFEEVEDGIFRSQAFRFLAGVGDRNLDVLAGLADDRMPFLSKGVAVLLGRIKSRRAVPYLARFKDSRHKAVRLEAVQALAGIDDDLARKILRSFEADPDPEVREAARRGPEPAEAG